MTIELENGSEGKAEGRIMGKVHHVKRGKALALPQGYDGARKACDGFVPSHVTGRDFASPTTPTLVTV